jgi:hypothetical protein
MRATSKTLIRWTQTSIARRAPLPARRAPSQGAKGDGRATSCGGAATPQAGLELQAHPHMLRHACGYALANKGTTPGLSRAGWGIDRSRAPPSTRRWRLTGSRTSGGSDHAEWKWHIACLHDLRCRVGFIDTPQASASAPGVPRELGRLGPTSPRPRCRMQKFANGCRFSQRRKSSQSDALGWWPALRRQPRCCGRRERDCPPPNNWEGCPW